jgi:biotin carboxyl carrier protein
VSWVEFEHGGRRHRLAVARGPEGLWVGWPGGAKLFPREAGDAAPGGAADRDLRAPMTGKVVRVAVAPGAAVAAGEVLVILEAMKMEYRLAAPRAGVVASVSCREGELVDLGRVLVAYAP